MKELGPKESGVSIVAVMVAMALFAVVAVMASQSFRNISASGRRADATMSAHEAEANIVQAIVARYKDFVVAKCNSGALTAFEAQIDVGTLATLLSEKPEFLDVNALPATAPKAAEPDIKRCVTTPFTNGNLPRVDSFYSCYNITVLPASRNKASRDAFAKNRGAFVEVYVRIRNLQTDQLITCDNVTGTSQGLGLEVLYSMHWAMSGGSKTVTNSSETLDIYYDNKTGSLSAPL